MRQSPALPSSSPCLLTPCLLTPSACCLLLKFLVKPRFPDPACAIPSRAPCRSFLASLWLSSPSGLFLLPHPSRAGPGAGSILILFHLPRGSWVDSRAGLFLFSPPSWLFSLNLRAVSVSVSSPSTSWLSSRAVSFLSLLPPHAVSLSPSACSFILSQIPGQASPISRSLLGLSLSYS